MKVLIVDDSISVRKALEKILGTQGFEVVAAEHAEKALEMMTVTKPELIIADVVMPGMTGFELCQTLKQNPNYQSIPLMLISGIVNANVEAQARQVGAVGVVKKPFTPDELLPRIKQVLQKHAAKPAPLPTQPVSPVAQASLSLQPIPPKMPPQISQVPPQILTQIPPLQASEAAPIMETPKPVKPAPVKTSKPVAKPAVVLSSQTQQELTRVLTPILEKTDVLTVLLVDEGGHCVISLGQEVSDRQNLAAYIKFLTSASGVLGQNLGDDDLKSLVLEYAQRCVLVSRIQKMGLSLILKDMASLSIARYVLKKVGSEVSDILEGKILV
jgi:CheY-like chemotaxis protein/predicted regulator of Ras-like GTPase activity (Roadblock/LC7/MglB family)